MAQSVILEVAHFLHVTRGDLGMGKILILSMTGLLNIIKDSRALDRIMLACFPLFMVENCPNAL